MTRCRRDVHRGLQAAGDAAVVNGELVLGPVRGDDGGEVVVHPLVDWLIRLLARPGRVRLRTKVVQDQQVDYTHGVSACVKWDTPKNKTSSRH